MWRQPIPAFHPQHSLADSGSYRSSAAQTAPGHEEIVQQLKALTLSQLKSGFEALFNGADDLLFEMAERVGNNRDQANYFDAMRVLRLGRRAVEKTYLSAIAAGFSAPKGKPMLRAKFDSELPELCLKDIGALERTLALESLVSKAQDHCNSLLWELDRRLESLIQAGHLSLPPQCVSPRAICEAFAEAVATLDAGKTITLIVYQLFERRVHTQLADLYALLLKILEEKGIRAAPVAPRPHAISAASVANSAARPFPPAPSPPNAADSGSTARLYGNPSWAFGSGPVQDPNQPFLTSAAQQATAQAYTQRAGTVGRLFNTMLAEPTLPDQLVTRFDEFRHSVVKTALRDVGFFENPGHPVRKMVNELASLASNARAMNEDSLHRIEEVVDQLRGEFDTAADNLRKSGQAMAPVDLTAFLEDQLLQNRARRRNLVLKVRRVVAEELLLRTAGRKLPSGVLRLLHSGWAPMVARGVLQEGISGKDWKRGMDRLDEILKVLDAGREVDPGLAMELMSQLERDFQAAGFTALRIQELLEGFRVDIETSVQAEAQTQVEAVATTEADSAEKQELPGSAVAATGPVDAESLLRLLLLPGAWFRVSHPQIYGRRWLQAAPFDHDRDAVTFFEFDGKRSVSLTGDEFIHQVLHGDITPLEMSAFAKHAIARYDEAARAVFDPA